MDDYTTISRSRRCSNHYQDSRHCPSLEWTLTFGFLKVADFKGIRSG
jgi:hypothetical protein